VKKNPTTCEKSKTKQLKGWPSGYKVKRPGDIAGQNGKKSAACKRSKTGQLIGPAGRGALPARKSNAGWAGSRAGSVARAKKQCRPGK